MCPLIYVNLKQIHVVFFIRRWRIYVKKSHDIIVTRNHGSRQLHLFSVPFYVRVTCSAFSVGKWAVSIKATHDIYESTFCYLSSPCSHFGTKGWFPSFLVIKEGRTLWRSDQLVARTLSKHGTTQTQNKHIHIPNIHALSEIRTHDPGFRASEDGTCLRPLGMFKRANINWSWRVVSVLCNVRCVQISGELVEQVILCWGYSYNKKAICALYMKVFYKFIRRDSVQYTSTEAGRGTVRVFP
jgi:hypothetical protein